jgi:hypothetical protein
MTDHEDAARVAKIRRQIRKFNSDKGEMPMGELLELTETLADEWRDEQDRIFLEQQTGACRACGRYRKGK